MIAAAGLVAGIVVASSIGNVREGASTMLDLWMTAGLLKLAADASWAAIASAAWCCESSPRR